ncbi:MAG: YeeE/YedE family protein [Gammaproteobacteria bacterium]|nr:YeeE/YedE family protein [Gammaproteobacteria bacterium]
MQELSVNTVVALWAFGLGLALGAVVQRTNFCAMGAISDVVLLGDWKRFRAWLLAIAVALAGTQALYLSGLVDVSKSIYQSANLGWAGVIIGGLMFGFGMTMTGGCGNRTVVRLGAGNLKSLVVFLVMGIFAYMTLGGVIALARIELDTLTAFDMRSLGLDSQSIPQLLAIATGMPSSIATAAVLAAVILGLLWFCFHDRAFRASPRNIVAGAAIGLVVTAGWYITGVVGYDDFEPTRLESITFVAPVGESLLYVMTFTGSKIDFGIALIGGVIVGAFAAATLSGTFRVEVFADAADMVRHLVGGALMGTGGVLALGCTFGQGITGNSTLSLGSLLAFGSIVLGGVLGIRYLEEGSLGRAIRAVVAHR